MRREILKALISYFESKFDVALSTRASESTLSKVVDSLKPTLLAENLVTLDNSNGTTTVLRDVFASNVNVTADGELAVQIALDTATKAKLRIVRGTTLEYYVNEGNSLQAGAWYEFRFSAKSGDAVNVVIEVPPGAVVNAYVALFLRKR